MGLSINDKHAIESTTFVIAFERPFSPQSIESLLTLQELLRSEYPIFNKAEIFEVRFEAGSAPKQQTGQLSGVFLQKPRADGRQAWSLRGEGNAIVVACFDYERWEISSTKAIKHLIIAAKAAFDEQNPLKAMALQVVDKFVDLSVEEYDIGNVFNKKTRFLTKQALESGYLWHVHQGWFEPDPRPDIQQLNILKLGTSSTPAGLISVIDHTIQINFLKASPAENSFEEKFLTDTFHDLHAHNKAVMHDLLNSRQKKRIKLC